MLFNGPPRGEPVEILPPPTPGPILVHVGGAVDSPAVYSLPPDCRVQDAIEAAGGLAEDAYTASLNLAAPLSDGDKILVPHLADQAVSNSSGGSSLLEPPAAGTPIDINTATLEQLDELPGIGPAKAQAIIDYREAKGPFATIEQIMNVPGIGRVTFENIKDLISVGIGN